MAEVTLLTLGDLHGRLKWSRALESAVAEADSLLLCGDLTDFGGPPDAERILDELSARVRSIYAVAGNCDSPEIERYLQERSVSLHGRGIRLNDRIGICGVSGSNPTPFGTPLEYSEQVLSERLEEGWAQIRTSEVRIIVHHAPPWDTTCDRTRFGEHVGVPGLRAFCEENQPELVICGHIHEARGRDTIGKTVVVNGGMAARGHGSLVRVGDEDFTVELL